MDEPQHELTLLFNPKLSSTVKTNNNKNVYLIKVELELVLSA